MWIGNLQGNDLERDIAKVKFKGKALNCFEEKELATPGLVVFSVLGKEQLTWKFPACVAAKIKITLLFGSPAGSKTRGMSWSGTKQGVVISWKKQQTVLVRPLFGSQVFGTQAMLSARSLKVTVGDYEEWRNTLPSHYQTRDTGKGCNNLSQYIHNMLAENNYSMGASFLTWPDRKFTVVSNFPLVRYAVSQTLKRLHHVFWNETVRERKKNQLF